jgi:hypothetical protein
MEELRNAATRDDLLSLIGVAQKIDARHADDLAIITSLRLRTRGCKSAHVNPNGDEGASPSAKLISSHYLWLTLGGDLSRSLKALDETRNNAMRGGSLISKPLKFQIIERAKELIQDERHWCRGYLAMDASGDSADPTSSDA